MGKLSSIMMGLSCCYICYSFTTIHNGRGVNNIDSNDQDSVAYIGRMLFYDPILSGNGKVSCASCHDQKLAFSDGLQLSTRGASGAQLQRNVPGLCNMSEQSTFFWDGGSLSLEAQIFGPLTSPDEMGADLKVIVNRLKNNKRYSYLFQQYLHEEISSYTIAKALATFERSMISHNSRYDQYIRNSNKTSFSTKEKEGYSLFSTYCQSCHAGIDFTDDQYHNNGLDSIFVNDTLEGLFQGRYRITSDSNDLGKYKTPSLRNVCVTAPYMHDGRYGTLDTVLEHYSHGIKGSPTLDNHLLTKSEKGFQFNSDQKSAIVAFLKTLTDSSFLHNPKYSDPFTHN